MTRWFEVFAAIYRLIRYRNSRANTSLPRLGKLDVALMLVNGLTGANRLWLASQMIEEWGYARALRFAERHAPANQQAGIHLLRANESMLDDARWLECVNKYLAPQGLSPVSLADDPGSRFSRLQTDGQPPIDDPDKITVIMPAFNSARFIAHAAQSILAQTWRNLELIIIDDCSTDDTLKVAHAIAARDSRVRVLKNVVNVGPYVSKNLALRIAQGKYITGQDADDWSHPQRLQHDMQTLRAGNGSTKAVLSTMLRMRKQGEFQVFSQRTLLPRGDGIRRQAFISLLIDAEYLRQYLGGWDSVRFSADSELIERAQKILGDGLVRSDRIGMFCLDHETSLTNDPAHGISKTSGISPTRRQFRQAFQAWHATLNQDKARLPFPLDQRPYEVPAPMQVPPDAVRRNIEAHDTQLKDAA